MPIRKGRGGSLLATGQTTQYNSELDDGYYLRGVVKSYEALTTGQYAGTTSIKLAHYTADTIAFVNVTRKITDSANGLAIFKTGDSLWVTGAANNANNTATTDGGVMTVMTGNVAGEIVLNEDVLSDESASATVTIAKREAHSNACVYDLNTGLMWSSTVADKMGADSGGLMPWTGQLYDIFAYAAAANTASLAGYTDWRVPNLYELLSILDFEAATAVPNSTYFPSFPTVWLWTATTVPGTTTQRYDVLSSTGQFGKDTTETAYTPILVRGG